MLGSGISVTLTPVKVNRAVADVIEELRGTYPTRTLIHEVSGTGFARLDENRLSQLIGNLVGNLLPIGARHAKWCCPAVSPSASSPALRESR